jgi:hypothetical protein
MLELWQIYCTSVKQYRRLRPDKNENWIVNETAEFRQRMFLKLCISESAWGSLVTASKKRQSKGRRRNSSGVKYDGCITRESQ